MAIVATVVVGGLVTGVVEAEVLVGCNGVDASAEGVVNGLDADVDDAEPSTQFAFSATSHGGFAAL